MISIATLAPTPEQVLEVTRDAEVALGDRFDIEAQVGLAIPFVRPVAGIAFVGKNRADIAIEFHSRLLAQGRPSQYRAR